MNCNEDIHNELKESEVVCPFCDQQIDSARKPKDDNAVIISILLTTMGC